MNQLRMNTTSLARSVACSAKRRKKPDYASRRAGQQEENLRRRANFHQHALSARVTQRDARDDGDAMRARSLRSVALSSATRRRGRPAHRRSPDDSPLRDGNRDRLIGMLTQRAAKTLEYYFMETNLAYHSWLQEYMRQNPIPVEGNWDAVSGEDFLRKLLTGGLHETKYTGGVTNQLFCSVGSIGIDPRAIGQRIMDIRSALAKEFIEDLNDVAEENAILMRECAMASLAALDSIDTDEEEAGMALTPHPEMLDAEPGPIPDTVAEFMTRAAETDVERYHRERGEKGEDATTDASATPSTQDEVRPGLDDINEFEAELEAPDKWARRFRILRKAEASAQADEKRKDEESSEGEDDQAAAAGAQADEETQDESSGDEKSKEAEAAQAAEAADDKVDEPDDKGSAEAQSSQEEEKDVSVEKEESCNKDEKTSDIKSSAEDSSEESKKDSK